MGPILPCLEGGTWCKGVGVREGRGDDAAWLNEWKGEGERIGGVGVGRGGIKGEGEGEGVAKAEGRKRNAMV